MINQFVPELLERLLVSLEKVDILPPNELAGIWQCARLSAAAHRELEVQLADYQFDRSDDEIHFFKHLKPQLEGRLLYYLRLVGILQLAPSSDQEQRRSYLKSHLVSIDQFYREHAEMHLYYRLEYKHLDTYYFLRSDGEDLPAVDDLSLVMDTRLHSRKSNLFSHFYAYGMLASYLQLQLGEMPWDPTRLGDDRLIWTASQASLVELIYALNEVGAFNHKTQDIKKVAAYVGMAFGIRIANVYATHEDNRMRKKNRTAFMDELRKRLEAKYNYDDEFAL